MERRGVSGTPEEGSQHHTMTAPGHDGMTILGDALSAVRTLRGVDHVLTGPPYFGLKEYPTTPGQIGNMAGYGSYRSAFSQFYADLYDLLPDDGMLCFNGGSYRSSDVDGADIECRSEHQVGAIIASGFRAPHRIDQAAVIAQLHAMGFEGAAESIEARYETDGGFLVFTKSATAAHVEPSALASFIASRFDVLSRVNTAVLDAGARVSHPATGSAFLWGAIMSTLFAAGRTVCDPFAGVGMVGLLGRALGRRTICIDVEPAYVCEAIGLLATFDAEARERR